MEYHSQGGQNALPQIEVHDAQRVYLSSGKSRRKDYSAGVSHRQKALSVSIDGGGSYGKDIHCIHGHAGTVCVGAARIFEAEIYSCCTFPQ